MNYSLSFAQETNSYVSGVVKSERNEVLQNATVMLVHEPTKNTYYTKTNAKGYFYFFSVKPGGPYSISISYIGFEPLLKTNLFHSYTAQNFYSYLQGDEFSEYILKVKSDTLHEVVVNEKKKTEQRFGIETTIDNEKIRSLPSISRNLQDYVRLVPNASVTADGGISLGGQNNLYNAFYIDGSNITDMLGLAASGTAGGQTGAPPISIEAMEEIKVLQSPYDVQYCNFTGGSINAITKSGTNEFKSSAWYYFRNEKMAGKLLQTGDMTGQPGVSERIPLDHFFNQTAGAYASGAFIKNKLFYFLLSEYQSQSQPQPYNFADYKGLNNKQQTFFALADTLRTRYGYDPGSFLNAADNLVAKRFLVKLDWNPDANNKLTLSYRYNDGERTTMQMPNNAGMIRFSNNRFLLPSTIHSGSFEWKKYLKNAANNRLLITYNNEVTERKFIGQPFPQVKIKDGPYATIIFGSNASAEFSRYTASEFTVTDILRFVKNKQVFSTGVEFDLTKIHDLALFGYFGGYTFRKLNDFLTNDYPTQFSRVVPLTANPAEAAARYNTIRGGAFINDEIQVKENLKLTAGIRLDVNAMPLTYKEDNYFNTTAAPEIEKYYDLEGAMSGRMMQPAWQLSPRLGFNYKIPQKRITIRGGAGVFAGHILNVWASQIYSVNDESFDNVSLRQFGLHFNPDPFNQPGFQVLGGDSDRTKGSLFLVSRNYKYPTVFRTSLAVDKSFQHNWNLTAELFLTKNIYENKYTNVSLLPSDKKSALPDSRNIYSLDSTQNNIPLPGNHSYGYIFLMSNNHGKTGYSYGASLMLNKSFDNNFQASLAYSYQNSAALFEPSVNSNSNGQWTQLETVNGKNLGTRAVSDFDLKHRISATITKRFNYGKWSTLITLIYNGQSGSTFSYVYSRSMINDNGQLSNADLIYIPTQTDLHNMTFIRNTDVDVPPEDQKNLLNNYIENDKYLSKHRGGFAARNGARLPFTHTLDLRLRQDFTIKSNKRTTTISVLYDVFNFTNMLNKNWGRTYALATSNAGNFALITFMGFTDSNSLTPTYQFNPSNGKPWTPQTSTAPGNSATWISQLGITISFN
jgi:hypothetical protein